jgi:hypothetical protein
MADADDPQALPSPAGDTFCTVKVPAGLHAAFDRVARARYRTLEWMILELMKGAVDRTSPVQYNNKEEDDEPLILSARRALASWRRDSNPQWAKTAALGGVLAKLRERAERTAGTNSGRAFTVAMNDLLERSGLVTIDKRVRSSLVNCFEHQRSIARWLEGFSRTQRPTNPRQIWRRYQAERRHKSSSDAANDEAPGPSSEPLADEPDRLRPVEVPVAPNPAEVPATPRRVMGLTSGTFAVWRAGQCEFGEGRTAERVALYAGYVDWMRGTPEYPMPERLFVRALIETEGDRVQLRGNVFYGIALKEDWSRFEDWLRERCVLGPLRLYGSSRDLGTDCKAWIEARGSIAPCERIFVQQLAGIEGVVRSRKLPNGLRGFRGIALKEDAVEQIKEHRALGRYDDETGLARPMSYRYGDEFGPLAYVLLIEGLKGPDLFAESGGMVRLLVGRRVMRKPEASPRYEQWCRSTLRQIFAQLSTANDDREIAQGLTVPVGWPPVPERVVERIRVRLAAAADESPLLEFRKEMLNNGSGRVDDRASEIDQQTSTRQEAEIIQYPRKDIR